MKGNRLLNFVIWFIFCFTSISCCNIQKDKPSELLLLDFSNLWKSEYQDHILGYVGNDFQRLRLRISNVRKVDNYTYEIEGLYKFKDRLGSFKGNINISDTSIVWESKKNNEKGCLRSHLSLKTRDVILSGSFEGEMFSFFYIKNRKAYYYDCDLEINDSFCNNQVDGFWKKNNSNTSMKCCWGEFRIPFSDDLDVGISEFSPNEKYLDMGWRSYFDALSVGTKESLENESKW